MLITFGLLTGIILRDCLIFLSNSVIFQKSTNKIDLMGIPGKEMHIEGCLDFLLFFFCLDWILK